MASPPSPIPIDDPDDPRIADYRDIRERDLVGRRGLFVAEGEVVLRLLVRAPRMETVSVLVAAQRVPRLTETLALLPQTVPVYAASQAVLDAIAGFPLHRGILALGRRRSPPMAEDLLSTLPPRALVVGLHGIANHDNMGALFRNAAAFGASAVLLDSTCCDPLYRKAIRVSVGAALTMPFARLDPGADMIAAMTAHGVTPLALSPAGRMALAAVTRPPRAGLILGAEGPGLPQEMLDRSMSVSIPMASGFDSLNVAVAAGIVLHHLAFAAGNPEP
jgi:tRNA G18 (ribose-2'-O)-methylase SpoU